MSNFETSDIYLSAYLTYMGAAIADVHGDQRKVFVLEGENLNDYVNKFWSNKEVPIVPAKLFSSLRTLKAALHRG